MFSESLKCWVAHTHTHTPAAAEATAGFRLSGKPMTCAHRRFFSVAGTAFAALVQLANSGSHAQQPSGIEHAGLNAVFLMWGCLNVSCLRRPYLRMLELMQRLSAALAAS